METWWLLPILSGFMASVVFTWLAMHIAKRFRILDEPDGKRKIHAKAIPLLGGMAIYLALLVSTLPVLFFTNHFTQGEITIWHFLGFFLGGGLLIAGGIVDDKYTLPAKESVLFPVLASVTVILFGMGISQMTNPFGETFILSNTISHLFTFLWLMGMIYTTKLLDGMDGLATGVGLIASLIMALLALSVAFYQPDVALFALIAVAVLCGFLLWNLPPAQIFLGEGGSTFVGFLVGTLAVISGSKVATALLVMGIPVLDVLFVMMDRYRRNVPIFTSSDRTHLHFRLKDQGLNERMILAMYYILSLIFGVTTLIFESWQKVIALGVLFVMMLLLLRVVSKNQSYA